MAWLAVGGLIAHTTQTQTRTRMQGQVQTFRDSSSTKSKEPIGWD